jgi:hypothetical protein
MKRLAGRREAACFLYEIVVRHFPALDYFATERRRRIANTSAGSW